jgi:hypothetical protein
MKTYILPQQMHMVGKAWEIRHHLRQLHQNNDPKATLKTLIDSRISSASSYRTK